MWLSLSVFLPVDVHQRYLMNLQSGLFRLRSGMTRSYDLVVIGAGPAGESAAELAAFLGHSVVIVEKNKPGGVVATTGGAPTKSK
jgi:NADPH-dependent glutamate synthase beta subunit-like oxidoreductase